jgi:xylulokinase
MDYWLGMDVGTTGTRALLADEHGRVVAAQSTEHEPIRMERPQWAEQDPNDWWAAAQKAIRAVLREAGVAGAAVRGIGLTGQMHGLVLLDDAGRVLGPALIWCDQRSQEQVDWINARVGADNVLRYTCNPALTGFTAPKLLWVRQYRPQVFEKARRMLLPKDYLRFCLTGEYATEVSDASGTALFDVAERCWSRAMISGLGLDASLLPRVEESTVVTGRVSAAAAASTGLAPGTPVVGGGGDQAAGGVGNGVVEAGIVSCTIGSSGVVFAAADSPAYDPRGRVHTFCHAVPGKWHVMGVTQGAGLSLRWFRDQFGSSFAAANDSYDALTAAAAAVPAGAGGLIFLPYLMGERTPHLDSDARGGWIGLTAAHTRAHLARAILEGVAFSLRDTLEIFGELQVPVRQIRLAGGGARSPLWRRIQADVFGCPCAVLKNTEGAAYGAALLAMVGTGRFASVAEACAHCIAIAEEIAVDTRHRARYAQLYESYVALYAALRETMHRLSALEREAGGATPD